jgi:hypothetical protein
MDPSMAGSAHEDEDDEDEGEAAADVREGSLLIDDGAGGRGDRGSGTASGAAPLSAVFRPAAHRVPIAVLRRAVVVLWSYEPLLRLLPQAAAKPSGMDRVASWVSSRGRLFHNTRAASVNVSGEAARTIRHAGYGSLRRWSREGDALRQGWGLAMRHGQHTACSGPSAT